MPHDPPSITSLGWDYWLIPYGHSNTCLGWLLTDATWPPHPCYLFGMELLAAAQWPPVTCEPSATRFKWSHRPPLLSFWDGLTGWCLRPSLLPFLSTLWNDWQSFRTKTISYKDHFVQRRPLHTKTQESHRTKTISYKDHFVQRPLRTKKTTYLQKHRKHVVQRPFSYKDHFVQRRP